MTDAGIAVGIAANARSTASMRPSEAASFKKRGSRTSFLPLPKNGSNRPPCALRACRASVSGFRPNWRMAASAFKVRVCAILVICSAKRICRASTRARPAASGTIAPMVFTALSCSVAVDAVGAEAPASVRSPRYWSPRLSSISCRRSKSWVTSLIETR